MVPASSPATGWLTCTVHGAQGLATGSRFPALAAPCPQFERFRRIFYTPYYVTLLNLSAWEVTSSLEVSERLWVARVHVQNSYRKVGWVRQAGGRGSGKASCWPRQRLPTARMWLLLLRASEQLPLPPDPGRPFFQACKQPSAHSLYTD